MKKRVQSRATQFAVAVAKNQALHNKLNQEKPKAQSQLWDKLANVMGAKS